MQAKYPELGDKPEAADGTLCHTVAKALLTDTGPPVSSDEVYQSAHQYAATVRSVHGGSAAEIWVEQPITVPSVHPDCWGIPDAWFMGHKSTLHVWDLKFGWTLVEAERNWQLLLYAIGIIDRYPGAAREICLHIVQPRPWHREGPHRTWSVSVDHLPGYAREAKTAASAALSASPICTTGRHCKYCSALLQCHAAQLVWPSLWEISGIAAGTDASPQQLAMELSLLARAEEEIKHRRAAVEAAAIGLVSAGTEVPGWQVGRGAGRKVWSASPDQVRAVAGLYGVSVDRPAELITPTQAVKAGLPADMAAQLSTKTLGAARMEPASNRIQEIFSHA